MTSGEIARGIRLITMAGVTSAGMSRSGALQHEEGRVLSDPSAKSESKAPIRGAKSSDDAENSHEEGQNEEQSGTELTEEETKLLQKLKARDREVRGHEQAHAVVGGRYAGAPSYTYQRGPDGRNYAISGEVSIDTSAVPNDPEATVSKMQVVRRAALAPAEPSSADRRVAQEATSKETEAKSEILQRQRLEAEQAQAEASGEEDPETTVSSGSSTGRTASTASKATAETPNQPAAVSKVNQVYTDLLAPSQPRVDVSV